MDAEAQRRWLAQWIEAGPALEAQRRRDLQDFCQERSWRFCFIGAVARQAGRLDEGLIWSELAPLLQLKGTPEAGTRLQAILRSAGS